MPTPPAGRSRGVWLAAALLLAGGGFSHASTEVGTTPADLSSDQYYKLAVQSAERDLIRKTNVAVARYNQRIALESSIVRGMQSRVRRRNAEIPQSYHVSAPATETTEAGFDWAGTLLWALVAVVGGWIALTHLRNRKIIGGEGDTVFLLNPRATSKIAKTPAKPAGSSAPALDTPRFDTSFRTRNTKPVVESRETRAERCNCYSCGKPSGLIPFEKVDFSGEQFSMCPSCARQHRAAWAV